MKKFSYVMLTAGFLSAGGSLVAAEEAAQTAVPEQPVAAPAAPAAPADPEAIWNVLPEVVAEHNGQKVTREDIKNMILGGSPDGKLPPELTAEMLEQAAYQLVHQYVQTHLLLEEAAKAGIKPSKEAALKVFSEQLESLSPEQLEPLKAYLQQQEKPQTIDEYVETIAGTKEAQEQIAINEFLQKEIIDKLPDSDTALKEFYEANKDKLVEPGDPEGSLRASHILVKVDKDASAEDKAAAKAKAEDLLGKVKGGESFEAVAKANSDCPSKVKGGSLGMFKEGDMVKEFEDAVKEAKDGEIVGPVETQFGYHIIRRDASVAGGKTIPFEEFKQKAADTFRQQEQQKAVGEYLEKLDQAAKVQYFVEKPQMPMFNMPPAEMH